MTRIGLLLGAGLLCLPLPAVAAEAPFTVGFAEVDVTPVVDKKPVYLAGFGQNRKATAVHDPIMARAVVFAEGEKKIAWVSVDVVGLFITNTEKIRSQLTGYTYVLVGATHNHHGPDTMGLWGSSPLTTGVDPDYLKRVEDGCVKAITQADAARQPATVRIGAATAPELLRDTRKPDVRHDELVAVQFLKPNTTKPIGLIVQWNCHPETLDSHNTEITADFPHYTVKHLHGVYDCPVVYMTGTVGGLMTTIRLKVDDAEGKPLPEGTFPKTERYGVLLGKVAEKAIANSAAANLAPFAVHTRSVLVPVENPLYRVAGQLGTVNRPMYAWTGTSTPEKFIPTKDAAQAGAVKTEVGYLRLGDLEVFVIPGEIYPELVLGKVQDPVDPGADFPMAAIEPSIYGQLRGKHKMLIGLGNDELGYIIPKRQWDEKPPFCYGLKKAQYGEGNSVGPEAAPILCGTMRDLVRAAGK